MPSRRRVVILSSAPAPLSAPGEGALEGPGPVLEYVRPASAYEAAAELLAGPAEALVIDLRLLRPCHVRLIEIAGQVGAKVLGVGSLPAWATNGRLGGLRRVDPKELAQVLGTLAGDQAARAQPTAPAGAPLDQQTVQDGTYKTQEAPQKKTAVSFEPLLTAEELSALLGDVT
jgi:hypothetical protein